GGATRPGAGRRAPGRCRVPWRKARAAAAVVSSRPAARSVGGRPGMSDYSTRQQILDFIRSLNPAVRADLEPSANLFSEGVVDSVLMMDFVLWLEEHFRITIDIDDLTPENFSSIDAIARYVESR